MGEGQTFYSVPHSLDCLSCLAIALLNPVSGYDVILCFSSYSPGAIISGSLTVLINRLLTSCSEKTIVEVIRSSHKNLANGAIVLSGG